MSLGSIFRLGSIYWSCSSLKWYRNIKFNSFGILEIESYILSELVCSIAWTNGLTSESSRTANKLLASSATRGWNKSVLFNDVRIDSGSDIGNSLSTENKIIKLHKKLN